MNQSPSAATGRVVFFEDSRGAGIRVRRRVTPWRLYVVLLSLAFAAGLVGAYGFPDKMPRGASFSTYVIVFLCAVVGGLIFVRWFALVECTRQWTRRYPRLAHGAWVEAPTVEGGAYRATGSSKNLVVDGASFVLNEDGASRDGAPAFAGAAVVVSAFLRHEKGQLWATWHCAVDLVVPERTYQVASFDDDASAAFDLARALAKALSLADPPARAVPIDAYEEAFSDDGSLLYMLAGGVVWMGGAVIVGCFANTSLSVAWPCSVFGSLGIHALVDLLVIQRMRVLARTSLSYVVLDDRGFHARELDRPVVRASRKPLPHEWVPAKDYPPPPPTSTKPPPWP